MTNSKSGSADLQKDYIEEIFEQYKDKSRNFEKAFAALLVFVSIFTFFILLPYVTTEIKKAEVTSQIQKITEDNSTINEAERGVNILQEEINKGPTILRNFIQSFSPAVRDRPFEYNTSYIQCTEQVDIGSAVKCVVTDQIKNYSRIIEDNTITPLNTLHNTSLVNNTTLKTNLNNLIGSFNDTLNEFPGFWQTFSGKVDFYDNFTRLTILLDPSTDPNELISVSNESLKEIWDRFEGFFINQKNILNNSWLRQNDTFTRLIGEEEEIVRRINQIQYPFGSLPIGLQAVAAFPLILAISFFIILYFLYSAIGIRKEIYHHYRQQSAQFMLNDDEISRVAPLWIDPITSLKGQIVRFFILLIPFVIFLASSLLVHYVWLISDQDPINGSRE